MAGADQVINVILRARNEMNAGLAAAVGQIRGFQQTVDQAGARMQMMGAVVFGAGGGLAAGLGGLVNATGQYQQAMNVLQATSGATAEQMARMGKLALELGADMTLPATSAADASAAMNALVVNGVSVENSMAAAKGTLQLAAAANLEEARSAEIVAAALNAFQLSGSEATRVVDLLAAGATRSGSSLDQMAQAMQMSSAVYAAAGVPVEQLVTLLGEMSRAGIKGSDAGTSLKQMLLSLEGPSQTAAATMQQFGINIYDLQGRMRPMADIIAQFSTAFRGASQQQRDAALATIFGSDAVRSANVVLMGGVNAFNQMGQAVSRQGAAADMAGARMQGLTGAFEGVRSQVETFTQAALMPIMGGLERFVRAVGGVIQRMGEWSDAHPGVIANIALTTAITLGLGGAALLAGGSMLRLIAAGIALGGSMATGALGIGKMVLSLLSFIGQAGIAIARFVLLAVTGRLSLGSMITGFGEWALAATRAAVATAAGWATAIAPILAGVAIVGLLYVAWRNNWLGIQGVTEQVTKWIGDRLTQFLAFLNTILQRMGLAPIEWQKAWDGMKSTLAGLADGAKNVGKSLLDGFKGGDVLGNLGGVLGLNSSDLLKRFVEETNLPAGAALGAAGFGAGGIGGAGGLGEIALDTGTKLSDLAAATQSAITGIEGMTQSAIDASIALGRMPGVQGFAPGQNGPFENVFRVQDIAQNLTTPGKDTEKWARTLTDIAGIGIGDAAKALNMGLQDYAKMVVTMFQSGLVMEPEVKRWIDVPKMRTMIMEQNLSSEQMTAFATEVGATPEMIQSMLGAKGFKVSGAQADVLAAAAAAGKLDLLAKSTDITTSATTVAGAVTTGSSTIVTAINNMKLGTGATGPAQVIPQTSQTFTPAVMPMTGGPTGPVGVSLPGGDAWTTMTKLIADAQMSNATLATYAPGFQGPWLSQGPMGPTSVPDVAKSVAAFLANEAANAAAKTVTAQPGKEPTVRATGTAGATTTTISVTIADGAVNIGGAPATDTTLAKRIGEAVSNVLRAMALAEQRTAEYAPNGLPGTAF